jgi:hypothetical protein
MTSFLLREIVELPSGRGKRVFDCHLNMLVSAVVRRRVIDYNVLVRRDRKRDVDTESAAVTVFVTGRNYSDVASDDVAIVLFQPFYFPLDRGAHRLRRLRSFKSYLQWNLHDVLSIAPSRSE